MLDIALRPVKDAVVQPVLGLVPSSIQPIHLTYLAFVPGLLVPVFSALGRPYIALLLWLLNRLGDGLDGAIARQRGKTTQWGGFMDIVCDFTVYTLIPIGVAADAGPNGLALPVLLGTFHLNNVILFYLASALPQDQSKSRLTALHMTPALIEGAESFFLFCIMIVLPQHFSTIAWGFAAAVAINIAQRISLAREAFKDVDNGIKREN